MVKEHYLPRRIPVECCTWLNICTLSYPIIQPVPLGLNSLPLVKALIFAHMAAPYRSAGDLLRSVLRWDTQVGSAKKPDSTSCRPKYQNSCTLHNSSCSILLEALTEIVRPTACLDYLDKTSNHAASRFLLLIGQSDQLPASATFNRRMRMHAGWGDIQLNATCVHVTVTGPQLG